MKITNLLKLLPVLVIGLSSCCHEVDCSTGQLNVIGFINFTTAQLNAVVIRRFPLVTTFQPSQKIDSFILSHYNSISNVSSDTANVTIAAGTAPFTISPGFKYEIYVPLTNGLPADSSVIDTIADLQNQVQACSGTEYTAKSCVNPIQLIYQDGVSVGSKTSFQIIYFTY
jgi:hypothetical protein